MGYCWSLTSNNSSYLMLSVRRPTTTPDVTNCNIGQDPGWTSEVPNNMGLAKPGASCLTLLFQKVSARASGHSILVLVHK